MLPVLSRQAVLFARHSLLASRMAPTSRSVSSASISGKQDKEPMQLSISDELMSRLQDKELLHACGFIGGKWTKASDRATYQVSNCAICTPQALSGNETMSSPH